MVVTVESAFLFPDSPVKLSESELYATGGNLSLHAMTIVDVRHVLQLVALGTEKPKAKRLIGFSKEGEGTGLKELVRKVENEGFNLDKGLVMSMKMQYEENARRLRILASSDVMESILLRLNFYFLIDHLLWRWLKLMGHTFGPLSFLHSVVLESINKTESFGGVKDASLTYLALYKAYWKPTSHQGYNTPLQRGGLSRLMDRAEKLYVEELSMKGYDGCIKTSIDLRRELWRYLSHSKSRAQGDDVTNIFLTSVSQFLRGSGRFLGDHYCSSLNEEEKEELVSTVKELKGNPDVFPNETGLFTMQLYFLEQVYKTWQRPPPSMLVELPEDDEPLPTAPVVSQYPEDVDSDA